MYWKRLHDATLLYSDETSNDEIYFDTIKNPNAKQIVYFLNHWGIMRRQFDTEKVSKCITEQKKTIEAFRKVNFEHASLPSLQSGIEDIFERFKESTNTPIGASKTLHVLAPTFFVMWDRTIRAAYGFGITYNPKIRRGEEYFLFLTRVQKELREAIQSFGDEHSITTFVDSSANLIQCLETQKTLAKIVDEYNFMKFKKGAKELWV